jgi:hypothetical protein
MGVHYPRKLCWACLPLSHRRGGGEGGLVAFSVSLCSLPRESLNDITAGNIIRNVHRIRNVHVYHDVFKVGNTAGEYTECGSSPQSKHVLLQPIQNVLFRLRNKATLRVPVFQIHKIFARIRILDPPQKFGIWLRNTTVHCTALLITVFAEPDPEMCDRILRMDLDPPDPEIDVLKRRIRIRS